MPVQGKFDWFRFFHFWGHSSSITYSNVHLPFFCWWKNPWAASGVTLVCLIMEVSLNTAQFNFDFWLMAIKCFYRKSTVENFDGELTCVWFLDHVQKIPPTLCWLIVDPRLPEVSPTCGSLSTGATSPVKSSGTLRTWKMSGVTSMLRQVRPLTQFFFLLL